MRSSQKAILIIRFKWQLVLFFVTTATSYGQTLRIYHIDVEQAAATLFVSPSGKTLLVDSGKTGHGSRLKSIMQQAGVDAIDHFVCTHYHEDHFGGIDDLVLSQGVAIAHAYDRGDKEFLPSSTTSGSTFEGYQNAVGKSAVHLMGGETIPFDSETSVMCVASGGAVLGEAKAGFGVDENDMSVALLIQYEGFRYSIGGDIEAPTEQEIADRNLVLNVDMYEADHHGSNTSSSADFMNDLKPTVIVISSGNNVTYKHLRQSTLDFYSSMNPTPAVFQTNKYLRGGVGGNVDDEFIADLESVDIDGTILVTVSSSSQDYTVTCRNISKTYQIKAPIGSHATIVIESILPDPVGSDTELEEITLRKIGIAPVSMDGWCIVEKSGRVWTLETLGAITGGKSATIRRNGMAMNLNNTGDEMTLVDGANHLVDKFSLAGSVEGIRIDTGH